jgi:hypothetical protein
MEGAKFFKRQVLRDVSMAEFADRKDQLSEVVSGAVNTFSVKICGRLKQRNVWKRTIQKDWDADE